MPQVMAADPVAAQSRLSRRQLMMLAATSAAVWLLAERAFEGFTHPRHAEMIRAAQAMQRASAVVYEQKRRRGLLPPVETDPNRTGLIGAEFTEITTTMGILGAKRTAANPDLAAALVRQIDGLDLGGKTAVLVLVSGSFVGANIAALAAIEVMGLRPILVSSLAASMFGANDPDFTWLDIEAALRATGLTRARSAFAVLGGDSGLGRGLSPEGRSSLIAAAARHGVPLIETETVFALLPLVAEKAIAAAGGVGAIGLFVNMGGALVGLGTCAEADRLPVGVIDRPLPCSDGVPGLIVEMTRLGIPALHILNMRQLALDWGLPYDPRPLPVIGDNPRVYGRSSTPRTAG